MGWTAPRTWTTAELVTAEIMNEDVRDNLDAVNRVLDELTDSAGVPNVGTAETQVHAYVLPGGTLAEDGDSLLWTANFQTAVNGNNKELKLKIGSTSIAFFGPGGPSTASGMNVIFRVEVFRYSATGIIAVSIVTDSVNPYMLGQGATPTLSGDVTFSITIDGDATGDARLYSSTIELRRNGS